MFSKTELIWEMVFRYITIDPLVRKAVIEYLSTDHGDIFVNSRNIVRIESFECKGQEIWFLAKDVSGIKAKLALAATGKRMLIIDDLGFFAHSTGALLTYGVDYIREKSDYLDSIDLGIESFHGRMASFEFAALVSFSQLMLFNSHPEFTSSAMLEQKYVSEVLTTRNGRKLELSSN